MLRVNLGGGSGPDSIMAGGTLGEISAEIAMVVADLYKKMKQDAPLLRRRSAAVWCA